MYFLVEPCYSSGLFGFFIAFVYTSPWQLKAQLEKLKQVRKACTHQWHAFVPSITCHLAGGPFRALCSTELPAPLQSQPEGRASWSRGCSCHPCGRDGLPEGRMCESCGMIWVRQPRSSCCPRAPAGPWIRTPVHSA